MERTYYVRARWQGEPCVTFNSAGNTFRRPNGVPEEIDYVLALGPHQLLRCDSIRFALETAASAALLVAPPFLTSAGRRSMGKKSGLCCRMQQQRWCRCLLTAA